MFSRSSIEANDTTAVRELTLDDPGAASRPTMTKISSTDGVADEEVGNDICPVPFDSHEAKIKAIALDQSRSMPIAKRAKQSLRQKYATIAGGIVAEWFRALVL